MAKEWGDRWGDEARFKCSGTVTGRCSSKPVEVKEPMYISDGTRALKLTKEIVNKIKTRLLIGSSVKFRVSNQTMYYTAQLIRESYADSVTINGTKLRVRAVMPFRGVWEFRSVN